MIVGVLAENGDEVLIRLPRAGVVGEWAAVVPRTSILPARTGSAFIALVVAGAVLLLVLAAGLALWAVP
jgi:hypothetical protein